MRVTSVDREQDVDTIVRYRRCQNLECKFTCVTNQVAVLPEQFREKIVPPGVRGNFTNYVSQQKRQDIVDYVHRRGAGNVTIEFLSDVFQVSESTIKRVLKQNKLSLKARRGQLSEEQVREIRSLYEVYLDGGISIQSIANQYGVSDQAVSRVMKSELSKTVA